MSRENVELIRHLFESFSREEDERRNVERFAPEVEWDARHFPDGQLYHGREGVQLFLERWLAPWNDYRIEAERMLDAGDDVVVLTRESGREKSTGVEIVQRFAHVWTVRDGRVVRWKGFTDQDKALEAVELRE